MVPLANALAAGLLVTGAAARLAAPATVVGAVDSPTKPVMTNTFTEDFFTVAVSNVGQNSNSTGSKYNDYTQLQLREDIATSTGSDKKDTPYRVYEDFSETHSVPNGKDLPIDAPYVEEEVAAATTRQLLLLLLLLLPGSCCCCCCCCYHYYYYY